MSAKSVSRWTVKAAVEICGELSNPEKMPGYAYGLPADECITGSKLAKIPGTICHICYAKKGFYKVFEYVVKPAHYKHFAAINHPHWVAAMVHLIRRRCRNVPYFRWHDSGDLQSVKHLADIVEICRQLPNVNFWLPTREYFIVNEYRRTVGEFPSNLVVRLSTAKVDQVHPTGFGLPTSGAHTHEAPKGCWSCPARLQGNACGDCRACWDPEVMRVSYPVH